MVGKVREHGFRFLAAVTAASYGLASCASPAYVKNHTACDAVSVGEILANPSVFSGKPVKVFGYVSNISGMPLVEFAYSEADQASDMSSSHDRLLLLADERGNFRKTSQRVQVESKSSGPFVLQGVFVNEPLTYQLSNLIADEVPYYLSEAAFETNC